MDSHCTHNQELMPSNLCTTNLNMGSNNQFISNNQCTNSNQDTNNNQFINNNKFIKNKSCTSHQSMEWTNLLNRLTQMQFPKTYQQIK